MAAHGVSYRLCDGALQPAVIKHVIPLARDAIRQTVVPCSWQRTNRGPVLLRSVTVHEAPTTNSRQTAGRRAGRLLWRGVSETSVSGTIGEASHKLPRLRSPSCLSRRSLLWGAGHNNIIRGSGCPVVAANLRSPRDILLSTSWRGGCDYGLWWVT